MHTLRMTTRVIAVFAVILIAGCGGGGGGGGSSPTAISGTAATGSPITGGVSGSMNGVVTLKDSSNPAKTVTTATDSNGNYAFTQAQIQGFTPPFMLQINYKVGGIGYSLASAVTAADVTSGHATINITPLTDFVIANLGHQITSAIFANSNYSSLLTPAAISAGVSALDAELQPILLQQGVSGTVDLLHQAFTANGAGLDAVLDSLNVTIDPATGSEVLTNTTTGQSVSGTLTNPPTTPLSANAINNVSDLQAITTTFNSLGSLLASNPSATDPALLAYFDQTNFLYDGAKLNPFLQNITTNPQVAGGSITFQNFVLSPVPSWVSTVPNGDVAYKVTFTVLQNLAPNSRSSFIVYKNNQGNWIFLGNQKIAKANIMSTNASIAGVLCAGLDIEINDKGGIGLTYAIVNGPQLPSGGLLYVSTGNVSPLQLAAGGPTTYAGTSTPLLQSSGTITNSCSKAIAGQTFPLNDAQIAALSLPAQYTISLYTGSNPSTDTPVGTYKPTLNVLPLSSTVDSAAYFASNIALTPNPASLVPGGGTLNINWHDSTNPNLYINNLNLYACANVPTGAGSTTQCQNMNDKLAPGSTSATLSVPSFPSGSTFSGGGVQLTYLDALFRQYWTSP